MIEILLMSGFSGSGFFAWSQFTGPILVLAVLTDYVVGDPKWLYKRIPHPVVTFGWLIGRADRKFNQDGVREETGFRNGLVLIVGLVLLAMVVGALVHELLSRWTYGFLVEAVVVSTLLAFRSLYDHVAEVEEGLAVSLEQGRQAVSMIVGRDTAELQESGVVRAALESLGENFSDGVVAPAFWYAVLGLPGIFAYKMVNTADSMIGHRTDKYEMFGKAAARLDDLMNWIPARLTVLFISLPRTDHLPDLRREWHLPIAKVAKDARRHVSPNAGWPEAALAYKLGIALGGPRSYKGKVTFSPWLNEGGMKVLSAQIISSALSFFSNGVFIFLLMSCMFFALLSVLSMLPAQVV